MVSCGTNSTGSKEDKELSVLDLLLQQDNFGDFDDDGLSDDFGVEYEKMDHQKPVDSHTGGGKCIKTEFPDYHKEEEKNGGVNEDASEDGEEEEITKDPIYGCTNPQAENYDPTATEDDGSCILPTEPSSTPPTADPDLSQYAEFLVPLSKADALNVEGYPYKGYDKIGYPKDFMDQKGAVRTFGASSSGKLNMKYMGERLPYYSSPGDGSEGYFKWIEVFNFKNASFWLPEPRPFHIATKYWRSGGYDSRARQSGKSTGCNQTVVKDGMYTAGLCPDVEEICIHTTGCQNTKTLRNPPRHSLGAMCNEGEYRSSDREGASTLPYHWMFRGDGWMSQQAPDWRYCAGVGNMNGNLSDKRNVALTWMTYNDPVGNGGYPKRGDLAMSIAESGGFNGKFRGSWPSDAQIINMAKLIAIYIQRYPNIKITSHHQYRAKACPNFWVPAWIGAGGIPGVDQAGIDKLLEPPSNFKYGPIGDKYNGYAWTEACDYGEQELLVHAGEELAKISNPGGVGTGATPQPPGTTSGAPINQNQPIVKKWQDMNCDEFIPWFNQNIKNNSNRTGFLNGFSDEDRDLLDEKTRDCSNT